MASYGSTAAMASYGSMAGMASYGSAAAELTEEPSLAVPQEDGEVSAVLANALRKMDGLIGGYRYAPSSYGACPTIARPRACLLASGADDLAWRPSLTPRATFLPVHMCTVCTVCVCVRDSHDLAILPLLAAVGQHYL